MSELRKCRICLRINTHRLESNCPGDWVPLTNVDYQNSNDDEIIKIPPIQSSKIIVNFKNRGYGKLPPGAFDD